MRIRHKVTMEHDVKIGYTFLMQGYEWVVYKTDSYFYGFKEFFTWHIERL